MFFDFRSCCGPLLYHLLLRDFADASVFASGCGLRCYWLHFDSASSLSQASLKSFVLPKVLFIIKSTYGVVVVGGKLFDWSIVFNSYIEFFLTMHQRKHLWTAIAILLALTMLSSTNNTLFAYAQETPFSIIWITDTQHLAENNPQLNNNLTQWIVENNQTYNIKMVIHTGDLVQDEGNMTQWQNANQSMSTLLDNGVPYTWNAGNHDYNKTCWIANQYTAFNPETLAAKQYWIDTKFDGMNNAVLFNASGWEWLIVTVAYNANDTVFAWANSILDQHPDAHAIVATHAYLNKRGGYDEWAINLTKTVLDTHPNVFLTLSGHYYPTQGNRTQVGGRDELLFNQQDAYSELGAASARILTLDTAEGTIKVQTYSIHLSQFVDGANNSFTLHSTFRNDPAPINESSSIWVAATLGVVAVVVVLGAILVVRCKGKLR